MNLDNKVWHRRKTRKSVKTGCEMEIESRGSKN